MRQLSAMCMWGFLIVKLANWIYGCFADEFVRKTQILMLHITCVRNRFHDYRHRGEIGFHRRRSPAIDSHGVDFSQK